MKRLIFILILFVFFGTFLFFKQNKKVPPLNTLEKSTAEHESTKYTLSNQELTITTELYTADGVNVVQVKTCKCQGCHWKCSE